MLGEYTNKKMAAASSCQLQNNTMIQTRCDPSSVLCICLWVDCTAEKSTCKKFGVSGYPTLKVFKNGEFSSEYNEGRDFGKSRHVQEFHIYHTVFYNICHCFLLFDHLFDFTSILHVYASTYHYHQCLTL